MNIKKLFLDRNYLDNQIKFFIENKQIKSIKSNPELVQSHIEKAKHNLGFFKLNKKYSEYKDWQIVSLYYSLYHASLALITHRNYSSKNHSATILLLIREYSISEDQANLINELSLGKSDAELYTNLKQDRHDASYSTDIKFTKELIEDYQRDVIKFINKTEELINQ
ncbi:DNA-binding protein [archaeon]|jgi:uncharacterized protein (UPF0332 family)|nr:DNA-binding protein [archaeon]MBT4373283.1 DNA-binding protein [archaeon]MBT4531628.1 DNA-binding protein [archaeon]MBT7001194.1 DNA-binding protein [archaeon]MBT7282320.1 DNA-binding protein [archaeon]